MTTKQLLEVKLSESRQALNALAANDESEVEAIEAASTAHDALEVRYRAAVKSEQVDKAEAKPTPADHPQHRAPVGEYLAAAASGAELRGAPRELNAELKIEGAGTMLPLILLDPGAPEHRADAVSSAPSSVGTNQAGIMGRVFAASSLAFLGYSMPTVAIGERVYPVLTAGDAAAPVDESAVHDAAAATFTAYDLAPHRIPARYVFTVEDAASFKGLEDALKVDLRAALVEGLDKAALTRAAAPKGLLGQLTADTTPLTTLTWAGVAATLAELVDGKYASAFNQIKLLLGSKTLALIAEVQVGLSYRDDLKNWSGGSRVSFHIPAPENNIQSSIVARAGAGTTGVAPVWSALSLIRDPYSAAASGQVSITANLLASWTALRPDATLKLVSWKLA